MVGWHHWLNGHESESVSHSVMSNSLRLKDQPSRLLCPWDSPGKHTGLGSRFLSLGDLPNPGIKPRSPTLQAVFFFYHLSHQGCPVIDMSLNKFLEIVKDTEDQPAAVHGVPEDSDMMQQLNINNLFSLFDFFSFQEKISPWPKCQFQMLKPFDYTRPNERL